jgi:hypothetical protein
MGDKKTVETEVSTVSKKVCSELEVEPQLELSCARTALVEGTRVAHDTSLVERALIVSAVVVSRLTGISRIQQGS